MANAIEVKGRRYLLTDKEACAALQAVRRLRKSLRRYVKVPVRMERDMAVYELHGNGAPTSEIAREFGISKKSVEGSIRRVEGGRYG